MKLKKTVIKQVCNPKSLKNGRLRLPRITFHLSPIEGFSGWNCRCTNPKRLKGTRISPKLKGVSFATLVAFVAGTMTSFDRGGKFQLLSLEVTGEVDASLIQALESVVSLGSRLAIARYELLSRPQHP